MTYSTLAISDLLVLEFKGEEHTTWHGEEVSAIACAENLSHCPVEYTSSFNEEAFSQSISHTLSDSFTINMSFSIFAPLAPSRDIQDLINGDTSRYEESLRKFEKASKTFKEEKEFLTNLLESNTDKLFVIAAGNGFALEAMIIPGVVVSEKYALYPSLMDYSNTLKVASLEKTKVRADNLNDHKLAFYSNFGTKFVDFAAAVPLNSKGETQRGTSFAAPLVSQHVDRLKRMYPNLLAQEIKEIIMKSAYIPNISKALQVTLDFNEFGKESLLYRAQYESNIPMRKKLAHELGEDIILVKSGGYLYDKLLYRCAANFKRDTLATIESACLLAHKNLLKRSQRELNHLQKLWGLRGL